MAFCFSKFYLANAYAYATNVDSTEAASDENKQDERSDNDYASSVFGCQALTFYWLIGSHVDLHKHIAGGGNVVSKDGKRSGVGK